METKCLINLTRLKREGCKGRKMLEFPYDVLPALSRFVVTGISWNKGALLEPENHIPNLSGNEIQERV
jgi:hypothetical protein